jgi:DNA-binding CsgD family transcriptional regulator
MPGLAALLAYDALIAGAPGTKVDALIARLAPRCTAPLVDAYAMRAHARSASATGRRCCSRQTDSRPLGATRYALTAATHAASMYVDAPSVALTARERQLAGCARQGLTNAEIAEPLGLSVRTVETHLYRAMQKLGVNGRGNL